MGILNFFSESNQAALDKGLVKTKDSFWAKLNKILGRKSAVDDDVLDTLEELLITADVGVETTVKIIERLTKRVARDKYNYTNELIPMLQEEITALLDIPPQQSVPTTPYVVLVVGVNGVGKTTTLGKLGAHYKQAHKQVVLGAADTFRAAAVEQLQQWGKRIGAPIITSPTMNADPAAVAYEAVKEAIRTQADVVLVDTAGRLHTKINLMHELAKIKKTIAKLLPEAPPEVLLVLDASTGQNAFVQASAFTEATAVTSLAMTKLDGTAKGGILIGIIDQFQIPIKYIGIGEKMEDLQVFDSRAFVASLFKK